MRLSITFTDKMSLNSFCFEITSEIKCNMTAKTKKSNILNSSKMFNIQSIRMTPVKTSLYVHKIRYSYV